MLILAYSELISAKDGATPYLNISMGVKSRKIGTEDLKTNNQDFRMVYQYLVTNML